MDNTAYCCDSLTQLNLVSEQVNFKFVQLNLPYVGNKNDFTLWCEVDSTLKKKVHFQLFGKTAESLLDAHSLYGSSTFTLRSTVRILVDRSFFFLHPHCIVTDNTFSLSSPYFPFEIRFFVFSSIVWLDRLDEGLCSEVDMTTDIVVPVKRRCLWSSGFCRALQRRNERRSKKITSPFK